MLFRSGNIPDLDGDGPHDDEERIAKALGGVSLGVGGGVKGAGTTEMPDLDNIPDMVAFMESQRQGCRNPANFQHPRKISCTTDWARRWTRRLSNVTA